tara:strand:- start:22090 stop:22983 length:894 start_codon:yes stop_codon:yes gene_type:complete
MGEISASLVKELREKTDAPMMECKKALSESNGDLIKAEELLRVKLGSKAGKTASRITAEGAISVALKGDKAVMVEVNCETDFVAKNPDFLNFCDSLSSAIVNISENISLDELPDTPIENGKTVEEVRLALIGKIGENISIRRFISRSAVGSFFSYLHGKKIGVLLDLIGGSEELGKDISMHIAAMKPKAVSSEDVDKDLVETERRVAREKAVESGKPQNIMERMVDGAVNKYLKEVSLYGQVFVKADDGKQTIEALLKKYDASVSKFDLFIVGEGLEKKEENFAAEVAATQAAAKAR